MQDYLKLIISIVICQLVGFVGSLITRMSVSTWYSALHKPSFTPPDYVFAPVWIILYLLIGIAAFMVWKKGIETEKVKGALVLYCIHLAVNLMWTAIFFGLRSIQGGFIVIIILWLMIMALMIIFRKISPWSAILLIPYFIWVTFAAILNAGLMILN
jgi:benzodiazapine receptor